MPRYIEQLNENITPATGDWLWIVDVDAGATDQDRKLSVGKLALLATANVFTAAQTIDNLNLSGNVIASTSGAVTVTPFLDVKASNNINTDQIRVTDFSLSTTKLHLGQFSSGSYFFNNYFYNDGHSTDDATKPSSGILFETGKTFIQYAAASATPSRSTAITVDTSGNVGIGYDPTGGTAKLAINGNVLIGTTTDVTSAQLQVGGTTGALLLSRLTTTQRDALTAAVNGMILYNSSTNKFQGYENGEWVNLI